jgi:hypothetical protein
VKLQGNRTGSRPRPRPQSRRDHYRLRPSWHQQDQHDTNCNCNITASKKQGRQSAESAALVPQAGPQVKHGFWCFVALRPLPPMVYVVKALHRTSPTRQGDAEGREFLLVCCALFVAPSSLHSAPADTIYHSKPPSPTTTLGLWPAQRRSSSRNSSPSFGAGRAGSLAVRLTSTLEAGGLR